MGSRRLIKRFRRGGGVGGSAQSAAALLGNTLLLDWYANLGGSGSGTAGAAWVDQVRGATMLGSASPVLATDPGFGNGQVCWKTVAASLQFLDTGAMATVLANGSSGFYLSCVFRQPTAPGAVGQRVIEVIDGGATAEVANLMRQTSGGGGDWLSNMGTAIDLGLADNVVNVVEIFLDAASLQTASLGGFDSPSIPGASVTGAALQRVAVGAFPSPAQLYADLNIWRLRIASRVPSRGIRDILLRQDAAAYGAALFF